MLDAMARPGSLALALGLLAASGGLSCEREPAPTSARAVERSDPADPEADPEADPALYDPLARARETIGQLGNPEATIPPQCYTKTEGRSNPCWTCHTVARFPNALYDWDLQANYAFSEAGQTNYWTNLFEDRREAIAAIDDATILAWIRADNYAELRGALAELPAAEYAGYRPDLDFAAGFDERGFARDGSGWRAFRYKPFPGVFWPTNGSMDDVMIRLPARFRQTADGESSRAIYALNLSVLEASFAASPRTADADLRWAIEPVDEALAGVDLDGDGTIGGTVDALVGLPEHYFGAAADHRVRRRIYPEGTEFLHSVRYLDPRDSGAVGPSARMKELRYSHKIRERRDDQILAAYAHEGEEKQEGRLPQFGGSPLTGLRNDFGWQLQGFIEDERGRLRVQTEEEHYACMGCHSSVGVTADQTFAFPRKLPGADGWGYQDLAGMPDAPQVGHTRGEFEVFLERAGAGDEFRANEEVIARFLADDGSVDAAALAEAPTLADRVVPSRERALLLDKAYRVIVDEQSFARGRDPVVAPVANVHARITEESTGLETTGRIYKDGALQLAWPEPAER